MVPPAELMKDPEAQPFRQAGSSTTPECDVGASQSQSLRTVVGAQPNGSTAQGLKPSEHTEPRQRVFVSKEKPSDSQIESDKNKKKQNLLVRALWTVIMISGFLGEASFFKTESACANRSI